MKRRMALWFVIVCFSLVLASCSKNLTEQKDIVSLYQKNEDAFLQAASDADYSAVERLSGVQAVLIREDHVDIRCGGGGLGPSTHYYGIFYSAEDDLCAVEVAGPKDELTEQGDGYFYREETGDNRYYAEPLGNHFYYYEAHF